MPYFISPKAEKDLEEISNYIANDNPSAAISWVNSISEKFVLLGEFPEIGRDISHVRKNVRVFPVKNYLIVYNNQNLKVTILRVLHGAREWQDLF